MGSISTAMGMGSCCHQPALVCFSGNTQPR